MKKTIAISMIITFLIGCDVNTGFEMVYQKQPVTKAGNTLIYCYRIGWGLDQEAWFLSLNQDICAGLDSSKDICFGIGMQHVFYKQEKDTLYLYSFNLPKIPPSFPLKVKFSKMDLQMFNNYESSSKKNQIQKINFDTITHIIPCPPETPYSPYNIKFKKK